MSDKSSTDKFLEAFAKIKIPPDEQSSAQSSDRKALREVNEIENARLARYKRKTDLIDEYANKLFKFMVVWTIFVVVILFLVGTEQVNGWIICFDLPEKALITLIGATTAQVIGLFAAVSYYLYKSDRD